MHTTWCDSAKETSGRLLFHRNGPLWILGYPVWAGQLSFCLSSLHQWRLLWHAQSVGHRIYWWYPHLLQLPWRSHPQVMQLQRFLGLANFYRWFIRDFSIIATPLTSMLRSGGHCLSWSPASERSFQELKERFTTAPILHHPDPEHKLIVEVDTFSTGIGVVLSQRQGNPPKLFPCA